MKRNINAPVPIEETEQTIRFCYSSLEFLFFLSQVVAVVFDFHLWLKPQWNPPSHPTVTAERNLLGFLVCFKVSLLLWFMVPNWQQHFFWPHFAYFLSEWKLSDLHEIYERRKTGLSLFFPFIFDWVFIYLLNLICSWFRNVWMFLFNIFTLNFHIKTGDVFNN